MQIDRYSELPLCKLLLTRLYLVYLHVINSKLKLIKALKGSLKEKFADMQEHFIYSYENEKLFTIYNKTIISYVVSGCLV